LRRPGLLVGIVATVTPTPGPGSAGDSRAGIGGHRQDGRRGTVAGVPHRQPRLRDVRPAETPSDRPEHGGGAGALAEDPSILIKYATIK
jgi:hypothetical protein